MNIRDLKYIISVAENRHFGEAAEKSFVSQPTLSMQIKKLEEELGIKIFERSNKNFVITEVGEKIIAKAKNIVKEAEDIKNIAKFFHNPKIGDILVGAFPTLASYFFPQFAKAVKKNFPDLKIFLIEEKTEILIKKLKEGVIDCAFMAMPINDKDLKEIKIFSEDFLLAVAKNNELARNKIIKFSDLKNKTLMLLEEGHCLRNQALEACSFFNAYENQNFKASSLETLRQMVACDIGITLIPEIAVKKNDGICYLKIANAPKRSVALFYRKSSPKEELFIELGKILAK
jgi:LysR family hydrogen peroxide-inducible transcriptional activator